MTTRQELVNYCNQLLNVDKFPDHCPNGLQVEGRNEIQTVITGVTASQALIEQAIQLHADAVLVHHGYFWKNEALTVTGTKRQRLQKLLNHDINLIAYHLPLDAHATLGNNSQLATLLGFNVERSVAVEKIDNLLWLGELKNPQSGAAFSQYLTDTLLQTPLYIPGKAATIKRIAWCTGAAQGLIELAASYNVDAYLTGEVSEATVHLAHETGLHFFAAGHHATERYGVQALGEHLAKQFNLSHHYVEIANPV